MDLMAGDHLAQVDHAFLRVFGVLGLRVFFQQLGEGVKRDAGRVLIPLRQIQRQEALGEAFAFVEVDQAFEVIGVIHMGVLRIQADKPVAGGNGGLGVFGLVIDIGEIQQRLLAVDAERKAGLEELVVFHRFFVIAGFHRAFGFGVQALYGPVVGRVLFLVAAEQGAAGEQGEH